MKKILILLVSVIFTITSYGQGLIINQSVVESGPYIVGDTITIKYTIDKQTSTPRYFWLRYHYSNKHLEMIPNSTQFNQGSSTQIYYTHWNNYEFISNPNIGVGDLSGQYSSGGWNYQVNQNWNVGQLSIQRTDADINGELATQKYIIKDNTTFDNIHKLHMAYSTNVNGASISPIGSQVLWLSLGNVSGQTASFKVKVSYPSNYDITKHNVQIMPVNSSGQVDWANNPQPLAQKPLNSTGEATFTEFKVGDKFWVMVTPAWQQSFMDDIITVSDAYKAFLGVAEVGIDGQSSYFQYPALETRVGNVTNGDNTFNEMDSYYLFAYVMGVDVSTSAMVPSSTSQSVRWSSFKLSNYQSGIVDGLIEVTSPTQTEVFAYAWGGDLDWSHSTDPSVASQQANNAAKMSLSQVSKQSFSYNAKTYESTTLGISSKIENGKVVLTTNLSKSDLAGLQVILQYDKTRLSFDNIVFNSGNTTTNFSTHKDNRITFGSIDQLGTSKIKVGEPYKLIFTPNVPLTNTSGLFYIVLSDAVNSKGNKINLKVE
jgi:hypothetical protein